MKINEIIAKTPMSSQKTLISLKYTKLTDLLISFDSEYRNDIIYKFVTEGTLDDIGALLLHHPCHREVLNQSCEFNRSDIFDHVVAMGIVPDSICLGHAIIYREQSIDLIDKILGLGVVPNSRTFWVSCWDNEINLVTKLILHGADLNQEGFYDPFNMVLLIKMGRTDVVLLILSLCNQINNYEELMSAARECNNQVVINALSPYCPIDPDILTTPTP